MIDPQTQHELEEKRRRHLEHQEYIKKQVTRNKSIVTVNILRLFKQRLNSILLLIRINILKHVEEIYCI